MDRRVPREDELMKCVICQYGETQEGRVSVTLEREGTTLVMKNVPGHVCRNCGEEYADEKATTQLLKTVEEVAGDGVELDIREYQAA
jgi:YgiT-type zinc finger domain-containing protein